MVKHSDTDIYVFTEPVSPLLPVGEGDTQRRLYRDSICLTKAPNLNYPTRYFRSIYDFSSSRRFKTVVKLEPRLAPVKYYRTINYGVPQERRHKSTVDCDFRPRAQGFSETTWIFPKHGRDIYRSTVESSVLMDTTWYKSQVLVTGEDTARESTARVDTVGDYAADNDYYVDAAASVSDSASSDSSHGDLSMDYTTSSADKIKDLENNFIEMDSNTNSIYTS